MSTDYISTIYPPVINNAEHDGTSNYDNDEFVQAITSYFEKDIQSKVRCKYTYNLFPYWLQHKNSYEFMFKNHSPAFGSNNEPKNFSNIIPTFIEAANGNDEAIRKRNNLIARYFKDCVGGLLNKESFGTYVYILVKRGNKGAPHIFAGLYILRRLPEKDVLNGITDIDEFCVHTIKQRYSRPVTIPEYLEDACNELGTKISRKLLEILKCDPDILCEYCDFGSMQFTSIFTLSHFIDKVDNRRKVNAKFDDIFTESLSETSIYNIDLFDSIVAEKLTETYRETSVDYSVSEDKIKEDYITKRIAHLFRNINLTEDLVQIHIPLIIKRNIYGDDVKFQVLIPSYKPIYSNGNYKCMNHVEHAN